MVDCDGLAVPAVTLMDGGVEVTFWPLIVALIVLLPEVMPMNVAV